MPHRSPHRRLFMVVLFAAALLLYYIGSRCSPNFFWKTAGAESSVADAEPKVVLYWTTFFGAPVAPRESRQCAQQCLFTSYRQLLPRAALLVFHHADTNGLDLPAAAFAHLPRVLYSMEPPANNAFFLWKPPRDYFNYSATYHSRSHAPHFYDDDYDFYKGLRRTPDQIDAIIAKKRHLALIARSRCSPPSRRYELVARMKQLTNITDVGKCPGVECDYACLDKHMETHFFYLAFENNICPDYVTEKFLRFTKYVVPVVLKRHMVPRRFRSDVFIAADDFDSAEELVRHLERVAADARLYRRHLAWAERGDDPFAGQRHADCALCALAHAPPPASLDHRQLASSADCENDFVPRFLANRTKLY